MFLVSGEIRQRLEERHCSLRLVVFRILRLVVHCSCDWFCARSCCVWMSSRELWSTRVNVIVALRLVFGEMLRLDNDVSGATSFELLPESSGFLAVLVVAQYKWCSSILLATSIILVPRHRSRRVGRSGVVRLGDRSWMESHGFSSVPLDSGEHARLVLTRTHPEKLPGAAHCPCNLLAPTITPRPLFEPRTSHAHQLPLGSSPNHIVLREVGFDTIFVVEGRLSWYHSMVLVWVVPTADCRKLKESRLEVYVCIAIGSIATLDLSMVVDLIGIYGLKGPYRTLTTTNWFLQALSVIPRGSWGDFSRRFYHDPLGKSGIVIPEPQWLWAHG
ncbi:hypothetical protein F511_31917 [Dorcoceras hygrometricum]|uniref:Uncharacterized protein n=1 Tax=Dorcoceras hygrometricum TaxID=472368 RepID=A0A2Z7BJB4_9LAMI|nr:hypothetical protein F511_31917 [Dorcoceras hygrometricum]